MIAIPNMEKPKECDDCPLCGYDERQSLLFCRVDNEDIVQDLRDDCPLIEIDLVRCEECMWWKPVVYSNGEGGMVCVQTPLEPATKPDDFCSYGERRSDEHTD